MRSFIARRRKRTVVAGGTVLALVFAGTAFALWSFLGTTNSFQGRTGTPSVSFTAPTAPHLTAATALFPGGSGDLVVDVTNPMSTPVTVISYQPSSLNSFAVGGSCSASLGGPAQGNSLVTLGAGITVPANATSFAVTLPNALTMPSTAGSNCQTQTITETSGSVTVNMSIGN